MQRKREWLFQTVAYELTLKGINGINLKQVGSAGGISPEQMHALYPDKRALLFGLVDEICEAQQEFIQSNGQGLQTSRERLAHFIMASLDFVDRRPGLAEAVVQGLMGSDPEVKEHVHDVYSRLFSGLLDDLIAEEIIPTRSQTILADLTEILLSVIFLGGCPRLQMDYVSFVDPEKVALSTLSAMKKHFQTQR